MENNKEKEWRFQPGVIAEGKVYEGMNRENKMLDELQSQTSSIKNIQSNVQFFFLDNYNRYSIANTDLCLFNKIR